MDTKEMARKGAVRPRTSHHIATLSKQRHEIRPLPHVAFTSSKLPRRLLLDDVEGHLRMLDLESRHVPEVHPVEIAMPHSVRVGTRLDEVFNHFSITVPPIYKDS